MSGFGLAAVGKSGEWEITIDEPLGESAEWAMQIDSRVVSFRCGLSDPARLRQLLTLLGINDCEKRKGIAPFEFGVFYGHPCVITLDTEFADRCFLVIGHSATATDRFEVVLAGDELQHFRSALDQVVSELGLES